MEVAQMLLRQNHYLNFKKHELLRSLCLCAENISCIYTGIHIVCGFVNAMKK